MIYTIYRKADINGQPETDLDRFESTEIVPENKAIWALIAPPVWLIWHRLWWPLGLYVLFALFLGGLAATPYWMISSILSGLPGLYLLLEGNQLRRDRLETLGYQLAEVIDAGDEKTALSRYVASLLKSGNEPEAAL